MRALMRKRIPAAVAALVSLVAVATFFASQAGGAGLNGAKAVSRQNETALPPSAVTKLKSAIAEAEAPAKWVAPGPPLKVSTLRGKRIFVLNEGVAEFNTEFTNGVKAAAKAAGMSVTVGEALDVPTQSQDILNAINTHAAMIILNAEDPQSLSSALMKAKKAGIIIVSAFNGDPGLPTAKQKEDGVFGNVSYCYSCAGRLVAEYELVKTNGKVTATIQQMAGLPSSDDTVNGFKSTLAKYCGKSCKISYGDIPINGSRTQAIQNSAQVAAANPSTNLLFPVYDFMIEYDLPQVVSARASKRLDIVSQNADLGPMQQLASGTAARANVGNPTTWDGWGAVDQGLRGLAHKKAVADEKLPLRIFDATNIKSVNLKASPGSWYGRLNFARAYEQLWGIGKK